MAVTFDYAIQEENNSKSKKVRKNQEVWFGNVTIADEPIKWIQINKVNILVLLIMANCTVI